MFEFPKSWWSREQISSYAPMLFAASKMLNSSMEIVNYGKDMLVIDGDDEVVNYGGTDGMMVPPPEQMAARKRQHQDPRVWVWSWVIGPWPRLTPKQAQTWAWVIGSCPNTLLSPDSKGKYKIE